jgi:hypothetical protein
LWRRPRPKLSCGAKERKNVKMGFLCLTVFYSLKHVNIISNNESWVEVEFSGKLCGKLDGKMEV